MAGIAFPTYAYQNVSPYSQQIVLTQAALTALGVTWSTTPSAPIGQIAPADPNLTNTDIRLQQILVENRITNQLLQQGMNISDDPMTQLRPDILANDSALSS